MWSWIHSILRQYSGLAVAGLILSSLVVVSTFGGRAEVDPARGRTLSKPVLGVNLPALRLPESSWGPAVRLFGQAGASWIRVDVSWAALEPSREVYDASYLASMDLMVSRVSSAGLKILFVVLATPTWVQPRDHRGATSSGGTGENLPPVHPAAFAAAMGMLAARFSGAGVAWELWNEPNYSRFLSTTDPVEYTKLACAGYSAIKARAPAATVVVGALAGGDAEWLARAYAAGLHGCFDAVSIHPYVRTGVGQPIGWRPPVFSDPVHRLMVAKGDGSKPVWVTEVGWSADPDTAKPRPKGTVSLAQQAGYTRSWIEEAATKYPYIRVVMIYNGLDGPSNPRPDEAWAGILDTHLRPKPVYDALKSMYR